MLPPPASVVPRPLHREGHEHGGAGGPRQAAAGGSRSPPRSGPPQAEDELPEPGTAWKSLYAAPNEMAPRPRRRPPATVPAVPPGQRRLLQGTKTSSPAAVADSAQQVRGQPATCSPITVRASRATASCRVLAQRVQPSQLHHRPAADPATAASPAPPCAGPPAVRLRREQTPPTTERSPIRGSASAEGQRLHDNSSSVPTSSPPPVNPTSAPASVPPTMGRQHGLREAHGIGPSAPPRSASTITSTGLTFPPSEDLGEQ